MPNNRTYRFSGKKPDKGHHHHHHSHSHRPPLYPGFPLYPPYKPYSPWFWLLGGLK